MRCWCWIPEVKTNEGIHNFYGTEWLFLILKNKKELSDYYKKR